MLSECLLHVLCLAENEVHPNVYSRVCMREALSTVFQSYATFIQSPFPRTNLYCCKFNVERRWFNEKNIIIMHGHVGRGGVEQFKIDSVVFDKLILDNREKKIQQPIPASSLILHLITPTHTQICENLFSPFFLLDFVLYRWRQ